MGKLGTLSRGMVLFGLASYWGAASAAPVPVYTLLKDRRPSIQLPSYSPADREKVARQVQTVVDGLYVNLEHEIDTHPDFDSPPEIAEVVLHAAALTDL